MVVKEFHQCLVEVFIAVIEAPLPLLQGQLEGIIREAVELLEASLGKAPKTLRRRRGAYGLTRRGIPMLDVKVLLVAGIDQPVRRNSCSVAPSVAVDGHPQRHTSPHEACNMHFRQYRDLLGVDPTSALIDTEAERAPPTARDSVLQGPEESLPEETGL